MQSARSIQSTKAGLECDNVPDSFPAPDRGVLCIFIHEVRVTLRPLTESLRRSDIRFVIRNESALGCGIDKCLETDHNG